MKGNNSNTTLKKGLDENASKTQRNSLSKRLVFLRNRNVFLEDENCSPRCERPVEWQGKVLLIRVRCVPCFLKECPVNPPKSPVSSWNIKVLEPEGNYGGGGIFVGVAPFAIITTNLGGSAVLHHHYCLDLLMITETKQWRQSIRPHRILCLCCDGCIKEKFPFCAERCKSCLFKGIPHEKPCSSSAFEEDSIELTI